MFCVTQQFAYGINSITLFSSTYSTRRSELLIPFCNGNSTHNSSVNKKIPDGVCLSPISCFALHNSLLTGLIA